MVNILVLNVTDATTAELKKRAKAAGKSVNDHRPPGARCSSKAEQGGDLG